MAGGHQIDADGIYLNMEFDLGNYVVKAITGMRIRRDSRQYHTGEAYTSLYDAAETPPARPTSWSHEWPASLTGLNFVSGAAM